MMSSSNDGHETIVKIAEAFADEFLEPIAGDLDRTGVFPKAIIAELAKHDLLALPVSKAGLAGHVEAIRALAHSSAAVAGILNHHAMAAYAISKWGTLEQKISLLPGFGTGEKFGALALMEAGPALGIGVDALLGKPSGDSVILNGKKIFVRNAGYADTYVGFASIQTDPGKPSIFGFVLGAETSGLSIGLPHVTMGLRGCPVVDVTFKDVSIDSANLLGGVNDGDDMIGHLRSAYSLGESAQTIGIGQAATKHAAAAAAHRVQFGHPIASLEAIQQMLGEMASDLHLAWLGLIHAAQLADDGAPFAVAGAMVQSCLGRFGQKILIDAIQIEGGLGISEVAPPHFPGTLPLARLFRDMAGTILCDAPADFPEALVAASL